MSVYIVYGDRNKTGAPVTPTSCRPPLRASGGPELAFDRHAHGMKEVRRQNAARADDYGVVLHVGETAVGGKANPVIGDLDNFRT